MKDKITLQDIEENIIDTEIVKHVTKSGKILRWAILTTKSGFAVTGRPSATINQANDNIEIGEKVAIDNAKSEIWALMGYHLSVKIQEEKENNIPKSGYTFKEPEYNEDGEVNMYWELIKK